MDRKFIVENIDSIMSQVKKIINNREYGMGISSVYYAGGTLCIDIYENCKMKFLLMVNISDESYNIVESESGKEIKFLLPLKALKSAFDIYELKKGKTRYYGECMGKSCIRHLS